MSNVRMVDRRGCWHPEGEASSHLCLHFWDGPLPVPLPLHDDFLLRAERNGDTVSITRAKGWLEVFLMIYMRFRSQRDPSLAPLVGKVSKR